MTFPAWVLGWGAVALGQAPAADLAAMVARGEVLLDDRRPIEARTDAAWQIGAAGDPEALWLLRAAAVDAIPAIREAAGLAALAIPGDGGVEVAIRVISDPGTPKEVRLTVLEALGLAETPAAAEGLYAIGSDREVPASIRAEALRVLDARYPALADTFGPRPGVVDPLGGVAFAGASGVAGGVVFSSVGVFGAFEGADVIGAVGGSAAGLGTGVLYAASSPLTLGEGLAYASGVSWGLTYGLWATTAGNGAFRWQDAPGDIARPAAGWRAAGVLAGGAVGAYGLSRGPTAWDVLEVDAAGYLGSAVALGAVGLAAYRPPDDGGSTYDSYDPGAAEAYRDYRRTSSQWLAGAELAGATVGLGLGAWVAPRWDLDWADAAFAVTIGAEAAWIGAYLPTAVGVDDHDLKGTIRLPWNGAIAAGLAIGELAPVSYRRTAATGWGAVTGNAMGGGAALVARADAQAVAAVLVPAGAVGAAAAYVADPWTAPDGGDAVAIGVGTAVAAVEGALIGAALVDLGAFDDGEQAAGLSALAGGVSGAALLGVSPLLDPAPDHVVLLGTAAAWGGLYGALVPAALRLDPDTSGVTLPAAVGVAVAMGGTGVALHDTIGLEPRHTVVPQVAAVGGGALGALAAAVASDAGEDVALGTVIGSTVGFGAGAVLVAATPAGDPRRLSFAPRVRVPGTWLPTFSTLPPTRQAGPVATFGVRAAGW